MITINVNFLHEDDAADTVHGLTLHIRDKELEKQLQEVKDGGDVNNLPEEVFDKLSELVVKYQASLVDVTSFTFKGDRPDRFFGCSESCHSRRLAETVKAFEDALGGKNEGSNEVDPNTKPFWKQIEDGEVEIIDCVLGGERGLAATSFSGERVVGGLYPEAPDTGELGGLSYTTTVKCLVDYAKKNNVE